MEMQVRSNISYLDIFSDEFLEKLYSKFEEHINNSGPITEYFFMKVDTEVLVGLDWINTEKILKNLGLDFFKPGVCRFLETHCYSTWFPRESIRGREFSREEKMAFSAWQFYNPEEDFGVDDVLNSYREEGVSDGFLDAASRIDLPRYVEGYLDFMRANGREVIQ